MAKKNEKTVLKKVQSTFELYGVAKVNDEYTFKQNEIAKSSDWVFNTANIAIECGEQGDVYCGMMGGYGSERDNVVYVHGKKESENGNGFTDDFDNRYEIDWDDRLDETNFDEYGNRCFINIGIVKDTNKKLVIKKFLSEYDAIAYLDENLEAGMVIRVKGDIQYSEYEGYVKAEKKIKAVYIAKEEPEKYCAKFTQTILVDKDSIGKFDKETGYYPITAKVCDYVGKVKVNGETIIIKDTVSFNRNFELMCLTPEKGKKLITKVFNPKKDQVWEVTVEGFINRGGSTVNITLDDLDEDIIELIESGAYTEEEALESAVPNSRVSEQYLIKRPKIKFVGDEKKPAIAFVTDKYTEEDYADFSTFLPDEDEESETTNSSKSTSKPKDDSLPESDEFSDEDLDALLEGIDD